MATIPTQNPVPSEAAVDLKFNAGKIDEFVTSFVLKYTDRLGRDHLTIEGLKDLIERAIKAFGFITMDSFEDGATLDNSSQVLRWESNGEYYRWDGSFPKVVPAASTPETSGGIGIGAWLSIGDAALRSQLSDPDGAVKYPALQMARWRDDNNVKGWGVIGDGVENDTSSFSEFEGAVSGVDVNLNGLTYLVDQAPTGNRYFNGKFLISGVTRNANYILTRNVNNVVTTVGNSGMAIPEDYGLPEINIFSYRNGSFAAGGALNKTTAVGQTIAIGPNAMGNTLKSFENIAIGEVALQNIQSESDEYSTTLITGTRNIGIGGNSGQFLSSGRANIFIGRNSATCAVAVDESVAVGSGALFGYAVNGWYKYIENFLPNNNQDARLTVVGALSANVFNGTFLTTLGHSAGRQLKQGVNNVLLGTGAAAQIESSLGYNGKLRTDYDGVNTESDYVKTGNNIIVTLVGHACVVGGMVSIYWRNNGPAYASHGHSFPVEVIAVTTNTFTVNCPYDSDGPGTCRVYWSTSTVTGQLSNNNTITGSFAATAANTASNATVYGSLAGEKITGNITSAVIIGGSAARNLTSALSLVAIGTNALRDNTSTTLNATAIGHNAGLLSQAGAIPNFSCDNTTCLGANSRVSGSNQVQLGDSAATPYAYNALQLRSDIRDKINVKESELGIEFILGLRPVQGNWNVRESYIDAYEVQVGIDENANPIFETRTKFDEEGYRAGTRARGRDHNWFIAQEVDELCQSLQIDFAGLQNHSKNGGCDVFSLGYEEFIPPLTKAVQQCWARMDELELRISAIEKK